MPRNGRAVLVGLLCALCNPAVAYADVADYLGKPVTSVRLVLGGRDTTEPALVQVVETQNEDIAGSPPREIELGR